MRVDLFKRIDSSFLSCEKDTETILRRLFIESRPYSDTLKKLLVINTIDCLTSENPNYKKKIDSMSIKDLKDNQYIRLSPKLTFGEHEEIKSYILISFDNFTPNESNPEFRDCTVSFDMICHTDYWDLENYQLRPLKIAGYIDGILNETVLSGIGKFHFMGLKRMVLDENLSGYTLMYRAIHSVEGDDKIPPIPPS
jgi:hypothetical protein